jgi:hypothetical protein
MNGVEILKNRKGEEFETDINPYCETQLCI